MNQGESAAGVRDYSVFGFRVRSSMTLPELVPANGTGPVDVIIDIGTIPEADGVGPGLHAVDGALILTVPDVARFRIAGGRKITIEPASATPCRNVRLYLLGSAFGALLHQRGLLPLHANAIEIDGRAVAFMGASGAGKSTLAAWFHDRGYRVISDDVCVVEFGDDGKPSVRPGIGRLRLGREALAATGRDVAHYERSFIGEQASDKYDVKVAQPFSVDERFSLAALFVLDRGKVAEIEPLNAVAAVEAAFANTYRGAFIRSIGGSRAHWSAIVSLVETTPMFRVVRRWGLDHLGAEAAEMLRYAQDLMGTNEC